MSFQNFTSYIFPYTRVIFFHLISNLGLPNINFWFNLLIYTRILVKKYLEKVVVFQKYIYSKYNNFQGKYWIYPLFFFFKKQDIYLNNTILHLFTKKIIIFFVFVFFFDFFFKFLWQILQILAFSWSFLSLSNLLTAFIKKRTARVRFPVWILGRWPPSR